MQRVLPALLALLSVAFAAPAANARSKMKKAKAPSDPLSSAQHRGDIDYEAYVHPIVITEKGAGAAAVLGVMVSESLWLEAVGMTTTTGKTESTVISDSPPQIDTQILALRLKLFLGSTFYVAAGVAERDMRAHADAASGYKYNEGTGNMVETQLNGGYSYATRTQGFILGFGNQYQWRHLTLGAEWAGVYHPFLREDERASDSGHTVPAHAQAMQDSAFCLGFMLGYSF